MVENRSAGLHCEVEGRRGQGRIAKWMGENYLNGGGKGRGGLENGGESSVMETGAEVMGERARGRREGRGTAVWGGGGDAGQKMRGGNRGFSWEGETRKSEKN